MRTRSTPAPSPARLVAVALAASALALMPTPPARAGGWSLPDESRGHRVAPLLLLSRADVRDDLGCSAEQAAEVDRVVAEVHREAAALKGRSDDAARAGRRAVDERQWMWIEFHLDEVQRNRLDQVDLRWEGPAAIATRPAVAAALSLSDAQKADLARLLADRDAAGEQFAPKILAVLDDGQKKRWEGMLGRPFTPRTASAAARPPGR